MEQDQVEKKSVGRPKKVHSLEEETTPFHESRKRRAANRKEKAPVEKEWYEWKLASYHDSKKERKLIRKRKTKNGVTSEFVGWEKQIPLDFLAKIKHMLV